MLGKEATAVQMNLEHHLEMIQFNIAKMARHDAILGIPWLEKYNPKIDWGIQDIDFPDAFAIRILEQTQHSLLLSKSMGETTGARNMSQ